MKNKSIAELRRDSEKEFGTADQRFSDFPIGTAVQVITPCSDFFFFRQTEKGRVIENHGSYSGIIVKFDEPLEIEGGTQKVRHGFKPTELRILKSPTPCPHCGRE